jgi:predicted DCC family thiol-disulfide oxidoreductase YuxK
MTISKKIASYMEAVWSLDTRSLAVFRIGLASIILVDLVNRARDLTAHYADAGILPRATLWNWMYWYLSPHMISGSVYFEAALFLIAGCFACMLLVGYKTRLATAVTWFLLCSLLVRNPFVSNAGDGLLRLLLLWGIFLPLGASYAVDSILAVSKRPYQVYSVGSVALILQMVTMYVVTALLKTGVEWHADATAAYYALNYDQIVRPFGLFLRQFPTLLMVCTRLVFLLEQYGPLLFFVPFATAQIRMLGVILFMLFHLSLTILFHLGGFPWVGLVGLAALIPGWFWDKVLLRLTQSEARMQARLYYDADCRFCRLSVVALETGLFLPDRMLEPAQLYPDVYEDMTREHSWILHDTRGRYTGFAAFVELCRLSPVAWPFAGILRLRPVTLGGEALYRFFAGHRPIWSRLVSRLRSSDPNRELGAFWQGVAVFLLVYGLFWSAGSFYKMREDTLWFGYLTGLGQRWDMFAPFPTKDEGWYVMPARLQDGTVIDMWHEGRPVEWARPYMPDRYRNQHWQKYMESLWKSNRRLYYPHFASYLCHTWNAEHPDEKKVIEVQLVFMLERTLPDYKQEPPERKDLYTYSCLEMREVQPSP